MTTWLELHQEMARHKKTLALARLLKVERRYAVGLMIDLWAWGLDNADADGNLNGLTAEDIAMALDWPLKKAGTLMEALQTAGWVENHDSTYKLHDWSDYTGRLSEQREIKKEQNRVRQQNRRKKLSQKNGGNDTPVTPQSRNVTRDKRDNNAPTVPNPTVPNPTISKLSVNNNPTPSTVDSMTDDEGRVLSIVSEAYESSIKIPSGNDARVLLELIKQYPQDKILSAISEAHDSNGHSVKYVKAILEGWKNDETKSASETEKHLDPDYYKNAKW